jgi:predicted membrane protein
MTPVKKTLEKAEAEENSEGEIEKKQVEQKKSDFEGQLTQLEATFTLDRVTISSFYQKLILSFYFKD